MSHKEAPPETAAQTACREFWQKAQPHVTRAWGRAKSGAFLAEEAKLLHESWKVAQDTALSPTAGVRQGMVLLPQRFLDNVRAASQPFTHPRAVPVLLDEAMAMLSATSSPEANPHG